MTQECVDSNAQEDHLESYAEELRSRLVARSRAAALAGGGLPSVQEAIPALVAADANALSAPLRERIAQLIEREATGLGPLEVLLSDDSVDEILVVGHERVWVERTGRLERTEISFRDTEALSDTIERLLAPLGRRVDELNPMADARLSDGSRVNVTLPPLSLEGPCLSIRKFGRLRPSLETLVESGTVSPSGSDVLIEAIRGRLNILISGGTGAGKTTLLNALSEFIDPMERVVTIEDAAELRLVQEHVVRLESRPANLEGRGEVSIRDLLRNALRMRPDRLVIGEVRGPEAFDLITALNTGHDGALSTVHANSPAEALVRVEVLASMSGLDLDPAVIASQLHSALDLIVQIDRTSDGGRRVSAIARVGDAGETISLGLDD